MAQYRWIVAFGLVVAATPLSAETPDELDSMIVATPTIDAALIAAKAHAERGELLDAIALIERAIDAPGSSKAQRNSARLIHAALLCRIGDWEGGSAALGRLDKGDYPKDDWRTAVGLCGGRA